MVLQLPPTLSRPVLGLVFWAWSLESRSKSKHPNALHCASGHPLPQLGSVLKASAFLFAARIQNVSCTYSCSLPLAAPGSPHLVCAPFAASDLVTSSTNLFPSECLFIARSSTATVGAVPLQCAEGCQGKSQDDYFMVIISLCFQHTRCQLPALLCWLFAQVVQWKSCLERILLVLCLAVLPW